MESSYLIYIYELQHDKSSKWPMRAEKTQVSLSSTQSDQNLRCPHEVALGPKLPIKRTAKTPIRLGETQADLSLCWALRSSFLVLSC